MKRGGRRWRLAACAALVVGAGAMLGAAHQAGGGEPTDDIIRVAMLSYGGGKTGRCFSPDFLRLVEYETDINVDPAFTTVALASSALFEHPFAIMTGEGAFELSKEEISNLRLYLSRGGTLLASAGCSNSPWSQSMRSALESMFPDQSLRAIEMDHPVFHALFEVTSLATRQRTEARLWGLWIDGRAAVIFSPEGLNDTDGVGAATGCCCCGGNEIREARRINANALITALVR